DIRSPRYPTGCQQRRHAVRIIRRQPIDAPVEQPLPLLAVVHGPRDDPQPGVMRPADDVWINEGEVGAKDLRPGPPRGLTRVDEARLTRQDGPGQAWFDLGQDADRTVVKAADGRARDHARPANCRHDLFFQDSRTAAIESVADRFRVEGDTLELQVEAQSC